MPIGCLRPEPAASPGWWRRLPGRRLALPAAAPLVQLTPGVPGGDYAWTVGYGIAAATVLLVGCAGVRGAAADAQEGARQLFITGSRCTSTAGLSSWSSSPCTAAAPDPGRSCWPGGCGCRACGSLQAGCSVSSCRSGYRPALTSALTTEVHYDRIPELVAAVREEGRAPAGGRERRIRPQVPRDESGGRAGRSTYLFGVFLRCHRRHSIAHAAVSTTCSRLLDNGDDIRRLQASAGA